MFTATHGRSSFVYHYSILLHENMKDMKKLKNVKSDKNRGLRTTLFVHGVLIALAMLPFLKEKSWTELNHNAVVEIEFVHADISSGSASEAPKEVVVPEVEQKKEVVEKKVVTPPVETAPVLTEETTEEVVVEETPPNDVEEVVLEEVTPEVEVEEVADEAPAEEVVEEVAEGDKGEGKKGEKMTGKKLGTMDFDGEGVFGRKVIHRADVKKITEKEGTVVINLCIDRLGKVTHVAFNREASSIDDSEYVKRAMDVASDYLFEKDYSAPTTQCGKLSFIFHIE